MKISPLNPKIVAYLKLHNLTSKFNKQLGFLQNNPRHPSLHLELLEPKEKGIRSFRVDLSYRALFVYDRENDHIEILVITQHYH